MKTFFTAFIVLSLSLISAAASAAFPGEQVWNATLTNTQQTCGIDYNNGTVQTGGILVNGEQGTDTSKAINFLIKANTPNVTWAVTESHLVSNTGRFAFSDDLTTISSKTQTSVFVNNTEYSWSEATQAHSVAGTTKALNLAPKIYLDTQEFPTGTTTIQGKVKVVCSN